VIAKTTSHSDYLRIRDEVTAVSEKTARFAARLKAIEEAAPDIEARLMALEAIAEQLCRGSPP